MTRRLYALMLLVGCIAPTSTSPPPVLEEPPRQPQREAAAPVAPCGSLAGTWRLTGTCGDDDCAITQGDCSLTQLACDSGAHSTSGSITGTSFEYVGVSAVNIPARCSGTFDGPTISGICTVSDAVTCTFSGTRR